MPTIRPIFRPGRLRVSRISFRCDVTNTSGANIPLGVMADIRVGDLYGLGLMARQSINEDEASLIAPLARATLARPFDFLRGEFKSLIDSPDHDEAFAALPTRHSTALAFENFSEVSINVPREFALNPEADTVEAWAKSKLRHMMSNDFWDLMGQESELMQFMPLVKQAA